MKKKNLAFTLAEVLIVIGIIGVVAALTLPNLNHATGDKEKVTKVKKIYSALTDAYDRAQVIYGPFDTWYTDLDRNDDEKRSERFAKRIIEFMKVSKDCGTNSGCISSAPLKSIVDNDGGIVSDNYLEDLQKFEKAYMVVLSDGTSLAFLGGRDRIKVDIDGPTKGKNFYGDDIHDFCIISKEFYSNADNELVPSSYDKDVNLLDLIGSRETGGNFTAWVVQNGNLDYLKCPDELNWETKTSCE